MDSGNFANDNVIYLRKSIESISKYLEENLEFVLEWFKNNYMKLNTDKCHLLISGNKHEHICANVREDKI